LIHNLILSDQDHLVLQRDIFDALDTIEVDLAYFDPPYGSNNEKMPLSRVRYAAYYHIWTTVCLSDKSNLFGKAKRRTDASDQITASIFEEFRRNPKTGNFIAVEAIEQLLEKIRAKHILLSYSPGGRATASDLNDSTCRIGKIKKIAEVDYKKM
jgi:adenine-specific DNA-methyltransferase